MEEDKPTDPDRKSKPESKERLEGRDRSEVMELMGIIHQFYDTYTFPGAQYKLTMWQDMVLSEYDWNQTHPSNLLFFQEKILALIAGVWHFNKFSKVVGSIAKINGRAVSPTEFMRPELYCDPDRHIPWECFPRHLTASEFIDPASVFPGFFALLNKCEWQELLNSMLHAAFTNNTFDEGTGEFNPVKVRIELGRLLDACHLIYIREECQRELC